MTSNLLKYKILTSKLGVLTLATSLALNGCASFALLEGTPSSNAYKESKQQDSIIAFGRTKADSKTMPANELLMLGNNYIYVITHSRYSIQGKQSASNDKLLGILNTKLSRSFELSNSSYTKDVKDKGFFPVTLQRDTQEFSSYFCVNYYANTTLSQQEQAVEQQKLDALQFQKDETGRRFLCMNIEGKAYSKPNNMSYQHRFETPIPVQLNVKYQGVNTMPALRGLALPFAAAADIVTLPVQAVLYYMFKQSMRNFR